MSDLDNCCSVLSCDDEQLEAGIVLEAMKLRIECGTIGCNTVSAAKIKTALSIYYSSK